MPLNSGAVTRMQRSIAATSTPGRTHFMTEDDEAPLDDEKGVVRSREEPDAPNTGKTS